MSIKVMSLVWQAEGLQLSASERLCLLAFADYADDEGYSIYPSYDTIARKCGFTRRTAITVVDRLIAKGHVIKLSEGGQHRGGNIANEYRIALRSLVVKNIHQGSEIHAQNNGEVVKSTRVGSDQITPDPSLDPITTDPLEEPSASGAVSEPDLDANGVPTAFCGVLAGLRVETANWRFRVEAGERRLVIGVPAKWVDWARVQAMPQLGRAMDLDPAFAGYALDIRRIEEEAA